MARQNWQDGNMLYPLPAVMVSCQRPEEKPNIITVAWTGTICSTPAMVSISVRPERYSYDIIKETGDFCGVRSGRDIDKFKAAHLTPIPGVHVSAPLIEESPVNIECRVKDVIELGSHHMFLADVLGVSVDEAYMDEKGKFDMNRAGMMVYSHGEYFGLGKQLGTFGYSVRKTKK